MIDCSKDRFANAMASLPEADIEEMIKRRSWRNCFYVILQSKIPFFEAELREIVKSAKRKVVV